MEEAIPVLRVSDASRALAWFTRLGYEQEWGHTFDPGDASPNTLLHLRVDDLDAVASEFGADVLDKPWGREVHLVDPDGNRLRVGVTATS
jgi:catechol 2,3-dioxygenase-like lactoylglutathione lyase family enzyme